MMLLLAAECGLSASTVRSSKPTNSAHDTISIAAKETGQSFRTLPYGFERDKSKSLLRRQYGDAGSTRMQVTTVELLTVGAAIELACGRWLKT